MNFAFYCACAVEIAAVTGFMYIGPANAGTAASKTYSAHLEYVNGKETDKDISYTFRATTFAGPISCPDGIPNEIDDSGEWDGYGTIRNGCAKPDKVEEGHYRYYYGTFFDKDPDSDTYGCKVARWAWYESYHPVRYELRDPYSIYEVEKCNGKYTENLYTVDEIVE